MRNDKERAAFIEDIDNWDLSESTIWTQTLRLAYEGHNWLQIRTYERVTHYTYENDHFRQFDVPEWVNHARYYKEHPDVGLIPVTKKSIIEEMKKIDKQMKGETK